MLLCCSVGLEKVAVGHDSLGFFLERNLTRGLIFLCACYFVSSSNYLFLTLLQPRNSFSTFLRLFLVILEPTAPSVSYDIFNIDAGQCCLCPACFWLLFTMTVNRHSFLFFWCMGHLHGVNGLAYSMVNHVLVASAHVGTNTNCTFATH